MEMWIGEIADEVQRSHWHLVRDSRVMLWHDGVKGKDEKAAQYLDNARNNLFRHLRLWLATGIVAPRTASIAENLIKELGRRLKKVGWNWSDTGATKMGRVVMLRHYAQDDWEKFWRDKMNLQDRCKIQFTKFEAQLAT